MVESAVGGGVSRGEMEGVGGAGGLGLMGWVGPGVAGGPSGGGVGKLKEAAGLLGGDLRLSSAFLVTRDGCC